MNFVYRLSPLAMCMAAMPVAWAEEAPAPAPAAEPTQVLTRVSEAEPAPLFSPPPPQVTYTDFGGVGHLRTPSARMAPDGEFAFSFIETDPYRLLSISTQILPRLEATARYVLVTSVPLGTGEDYVDKGVDLKYALLQESDRLPQLAVGLRDIAGTGLFSSEYVVASKRLNNWDLSVGLGWGNLASQAHGVKSPLCNLADRFCERDQGFSGTGGNFSVERFFAGPVSPFVGVVWQTPHAPLRVVAEIEGNDYDNELVAGPLKQDSPFNIGAVYRTHPNIDLNAGFERGNTVTFGVTLRTNFNTLSQAKIEPAKAAINQPLPAQADLPGLAEKLSTQAGFQVQAISQREQTLVVSGEQTVYRNNSEARERTLRVMHANTPALMDAFEFVETVNNQPMVATTVQRHLLMDALTPSDQQPVLNEVVQITEPVPVTDLLFTPQASPWQVTLNPFLQQGFGGVDSFYFYEVGAKAEVKYQKNQQLFETTVLAGLFNNYNFQSSNAPTSLPQVRIRIREYLDEQPIRLEALQASRFFKPAQSVYAQANAGFLELMFAGAGGEVLYRPLGATWGVGMDLSLVRQRAPDQMFGIESYQVLTGHVTYYQQLPSFHNTQLKLSVGQYLAGDRGATIDFSRRFNSGVVLGAFATKTNVSAVEYGEGSFSKGFYLSIPIDLMTVRHTKARASINFVPIQRDGGSMLYRRHQLWDMTAARGGSIDTAGLSLGGY